MRQERNDETLQLIHPAIGSAAMEQALEASRGMTAEQAVALALEGLS